MNQGEDRIEIDEHFRSAVAALGAATAPPRPSAADELLALFDAQAGSRHLDLSLIHISEPTRPY